MKRWFSRTLLLAMLTLLLGVQGVLADGSKGLEQFPYQSKQEVHIQANDPFFILDIDPSTAASMQASARDLRLFSGDYELGYAMIPVPTDSSRTETRLEILNKGSYEDQTYSFVAVMPKDGPASTSMVIKLDQEPYLVKGTLYGSNDNRSWQRLSPVTIFGIDQQYSEISLAGIDYAYLKFELQPPAGESIQVEEAVLYSTEGLDLRDHSVWTEHPIQVTEERKESHLLIDLEHRNRISTEWVLEIPEQGFYRKASVEGSQDQTHWEPIGTTYIYRGVSKGDESLSYRYPPAPYRYLRIRILNEDNEAVPAASIQVRTHPMRLLVKTPPTLAGSSMMLSAYWGNEQIQAPSYDVKEWMGSVELEQLTVAALAKPTANPDYQPEEVPLTERFPYLMPFALVLASLGVGFILYRNVKQMGK